MSLKPLPRGIRTAPYLNADGITETHYRVRLVRENEQFKVDRRFHTLTHAVAFLDECKTPEGRKRIKDGIDPPTRAIQVEQITARAQAADSDNSGKYDQIIARLWADAHDGLAGKHFTVADAIASYSRLHIWPLVGKDDDGNPLAEGLPLPDVRPNHRDSAKKRERDLATIAAVKLPYMPEEKLPETARNMAGEFWRQLFELYGELRPFGEWPLIHVNKKAGRDYIDARAGKYKTKNGREGIRSVSTVKREISLLSAVFAYLELAEDLPQVWQAIGAKNPLVGVLDKKHLALKLIGPEHKRLSPPAEKSWDELTPDNEKKLIRALEALRDRKKYRTPTCGEPLLIFKLSLATSLRLSECVLLEWSYIDLAKNSIWIPKEASKTKEKRRVHINAEAREIINSLPRERGAKRLFRISVSGLNSAMFKIYHNKKDPITGFSWHDLRRTAITTYINDPKSTPLKAANRFGYKTVNPVREQFEKRNEDKAFDTGEFTEELFLWWSVNRPGFSRHS